jgi:hypothetical protein
MPNDELTKVEYLGDGLYAECTGDMIRLFASNGVTTTNEVYLDPAVLQAFLNYVKTIRERS